MIEFTSKKFAGNPLAVVLDAEGLDGTTMQAIAREFNLSETVFVLPAAERSHRARVRIFTPAMELPFAGHPTIGTAVLLGRMDRNAACEIVLEEDVGNVRCVVEPIGADRGRASFDLPRLPQETGPAAAGSELAAALGIDAREIGFERFVPMCWSAGADYTFVPVRGLDGLRTCRIDPAHWHAIDRHGPGGAFVFCRETVEQGNTFHARMFAPSFGVPEDPATGSAAAAFAGAARALRDACRRPTRVPDRAGLRDGAAEPDRAFDLDQTAKARVGGGGRRSHHRHGRHDRGLNFPCKIAFFRLMANITLLPVERLELRFVPKQWPFATERRAEIDRYFAHMRRGKPELWNGRVLVLHDFAVADGVFRGAYLETDFASFLAWRDWGFPDKSVRNCFAMGALRAADGAFVLGVMGGHTANAGKVYFIGGTPDLDDVVGAQVDLERSVLRELAEETGLSPDSVDPEPGWRAIFDSGRIAMVKVLRAAEPAAALRQKILAFLARERTPELAGVHIVRSPADLDPMMPAFVPKFFDHVWQTADDRERTNENR